MKNTKGQVLTKCAAFAAVFILLAIIAAPKFLGSDTAPNMSQSTLVLYTE